MFGHPSAGLTHSTLVSVSYLVDFPLLSAARGGSATDGIAREGMNSQMANIPVASADCIGATVRRDDLHDVVALQPSHAGGSSSYANALHPHLLNHSRYPPIAKHPVRKGNYLSITLDDKLHQIGLREHEHSLIGRMLFKTGLRQMVILMQFAGHTHHHRIDNLLMTPNLSLHRESRVADLLKTRRGGH